MDAPPLPTTGWNLPSVYQVVGPPNVNGWQVILVHANNPNWTDTSIPVSPAQAMYLNCQITGIWQPANGAPCNADGVGANGNNPPNGIAGVGAPMPGAPVGALVGKIGPGGKPFIVGETFQASVPPSGSGDIFLIMNANPNQYPQALGEMACRFVLGPP